LLSLLLTLFMRQRNVWCDLSGQPRPYIGAAKSPLYQIQKTKLNPNAF